VRVREARDAAACAEQALRRTREALAVQSPADVVAQRLSAADDCCWEMERRIASIRDVAARLPEPNPTVEDALASLEGAGLELRIALRDLSGSGASTEAVTRIMTTLSGAIAAADQCIAASESVSAASAGQVR
jgi:hypothetical protein